MSPRDRKLPAASDQTEHSRRHGGTDRRDRGRGGAQNTRRESEPRDRPRFRGNPKAISEADATVDEDEEEEEESQAVRTVTRHDRDGSGGRSQPDSRDSAVTTISGDRRPRDYQLEYSSGRRPPYQNTDMSFRPLAPARTRSDQQVVQPVFNTSLNSLGTAYVAIPVGEYERCRRFITTYPDILKHDENLYLREATAALRSDKVPYARSCIQQALIIRELKDKDSRRCQHFFDLLEDEDKEVLGDLLDNFDRTLHVIQRNVAATTAARPQQQTSSTTVSYGPPTSGNDRHSRRSGRTEEGDDETVGQNRPDELTTGLSRLASHATGGRSSARGQTSGNDRHSRRSGRDEDDDDETIGQDRPDELTTGLSRLASHATGGRSSARGQTSGNDRHSRRSGKDEDDDDETIGQDRPDEFTMGLSRLTLQSMNSRPEARSRPHHPVAPVPAAAESRQYRYGRDSAEALGGTPGPLPPIALLSTSRISQGTYIRGTQGEQEPLDGRYYKRSSVDAGRFFKIGRVFSLLWHENAGNRATGSQKGIFGERIYSEIRFMAVVKEGHGNCWAVPINTYEGRGVAKRGLNQADINGHAVIYTANRHPNPAENEPVMVKRPIQVNPADDDQALDPMSRINFTKVHTVEHNVKVMNVGTIAPNSKPYFINYWNTQVSPDERRQASR